MDSTQRPIKCLRVTSSMRQDVVYWLSFTMVEVEFLHNQHRQMLQQLRLGSNLSCDPWKPTSQRICFISAWYQSGMWQFVRPGIYKQLSGLPFSLMAKQHLLDRWDNHREHQFILAIQEYIADQSQPICKLEHYNYDLSVRDSDSED